MGGVKKLSSCKILGVLTMHSCDDRKPPGTFHMVHLLEGFSSMGFSICCVRYELFLKGFPTVIAFSRASVCESIITPSREDINRESIPVTFSGDSL